MNMAEKRWQMETRRQMADGDKTTDGSGDGRRKPNGRGVQMAAGDETTDDMWQIEEMADGETTDGR